jgi:hypothetical protein
MKELNITPKAMENLKQRWDTEFKGKEVAVILADLHSNGSIIFIEMKLLDYIKKNQHYVELFPKGYNDFEFPIYVDLQIQREGYLAERGVIDHTKSLTNIRKLEFKNPDFEN